MIGDLYLKPVKANLTHDTDIFAMKPYVKIIVG
jgi:hypothetical protein